MFAVKMMRNPRIASLLRRHYPSTGALILCVVLLGTCVFDGTFPAFEALDTCQREILGVDVGLTLGIVLCGCARLQWCIYWWSPMIPTRFCMNTWENRERGAEMRVCRS